MKDMALEKEDLAEFKTTISSLNWTTDFLEFCRILNLSSNTNDIHPNEKWSQFQKLTTALNSFDTDTLWKLVETYRASQTPAFIENKDDGEDNDDDYDESEFEPYYCQ